MRWVWVPWAGSSPYKGCCMVLTEEPHEAEDKTAFVAPGSPTAIRNI